MRTSVRVCVYVDVCVAALGDGLITHTDEAPAPIRLAKHLWFLLTSALHSRLLEPCVGILEFEWESLITDNNALSMHPD